MSVKLITIRLFITPKTWVVSHATDFLTRVIPDEDQGESLKKRKRRLLAYYQYKDELREEAARVGFTLPTDGAWVKFYLPVPKSWSKKKKSKMDFEPHQSRPDVSNLYKAFEDGLIDQDMKIYDVRISKYWYNSVKGFIEIIMPESDIDMKAIALLQLETHKSRYQREVQLIDQIQ